ncbi:MAG: acetylxylan esterase [Bacteroidales bacterium]|nr:acetylxylan esterase [Bacteroidales bacterium]
MMKTRILSVLTVVAAGLLCACQAQKPSFVEVKDGKFVCEDYPSHYVGTNFWYGAILGSEGVGGDRARLEAELDTLKALGMTNLRVLVGGDGPDGIPTRVSPTLQKEPGVYNDTIFWGLDYLLAEMGERNMKAVLYINNSWEWSGGYGMYLEWAGEGKALIPAEVGYSAFMNSVSKFVTNEKAKELFYDHVKHVVSRTNTVTGKPYKDDPAIFSWQIGNEPRCFRADKEGQDAFVDYMWTTAALIKSIDPNHMVSSGNEGEMGCENSMELYERIHSCPDIDYMNIHIWPYNWNWVRENTLATNLPVAIKNTDDYIDAHLELAAKYGKPVVLEEFGFPRDGFQFKQGTSTDSRDAYYKHVFGRIIESAREGGLFAGLNFWGWGGLAGQSETNIYWQPGDDYCGDPAQEQQGLNSVYASDVSTTAIIKESSEAIERALLPKARFVLEENSGIFTGNGPHTVEVELTSSTAKKAELLLEISTDFGCPVTTASKTVKFQEGKAVTSFGLNLEPGFYAAVLSLVNEDGSKVEIDRTNLGFNPEQIVSDQDKQPDFDAFWEQTLAELAAVAPDYKFTLLEDHSNDVRKSYRVDMKSLGGEQVSGLLLLPTAEGKYPAVISYMGYGSDVWYADPSSNPDRIEFMLCIRNQAFNRVPGEKDDWCTRGLGDEYAYYYRGAFADAVRAIDFVCSLPQTDTERVVAYGESQGGALTLVAASLDHRLKAIAPSAPFLNDYKDYFVLADWPGNWYIQAAKERGISDEDLYRCLSYFDVKNFTDRIQCPVLMAIGLQDTVCPPHTNFAGYNQIKTEKSWICYPAAGHNVWQQEGWSVAREDFLKKYL